MSKRADVAVKKGGGAQESKIIGLRVRNLVALIDLISFTPLSG